VFLAVSEAVEGMVNSVTCSRAGLVTESVLDSAVCSRVFMESSDVKLVKGEEMDESSASCVKVSVGTVTAGGSAFSGVAESVVAAAVWDLSLGGTDLSLGATIGNHNIDSNDER